MLMTTNKFLVLVLVVLFNACLFQSDNNTTATVDSFTITPYSSYTLVQKTDTSLRLRWDMAGYSCLDSVTPIPISDTTENKFILSGDTLKFWYVYRDDSISYYDMYIRLSKGQDVFGVWKRVKTQVENPLHGTIPSELSRELKLADSSYLDEQMIINESKLELNYRRPTLRMIWEKLLNYDNITYKFTGNQKTELTNKKGQSLTIFENNMRDLVFSSSEPKNNSFTDFYVTTSCPKPEYPAWYEDFFLEQ